MQKYPYLLYINNENYINNECISLIQESEELHILAPFVYDFSILEHYNTYIYVFNKEQYQQAVNKNWNYHIALIGEEIFNDELILLAKENTEIFWFPLESQINSINIDEFIARLNDINKPICINYNSYVQKIENLENFRLFIKKIHEKFSNSVLYKELNLLEQELDSSLEHNFVLIQQQKKYSVHNLILGLFGDFPVINIEEYDSINKKTILKNKECIACNYNDSCIQRGIGYIMNNLNYKGCISIKLLQP